MSRVHFLKLWCSSMLECKNIWGYREFGDRKRFLNKKQPKINSKSAWHDFQVFLLWLLHVVSCFLLHVALTQNKCVVSTLHMPIISPSTSELLLKDTSSNLRRLWISTAVVLAYVASPDTEAGLITENSFLCFPTTFLSMNQISASLDSTMLGCFIWEMLLIWL